jgi:lipid-binding SYLF domain-containing protein
MQARIAFALATLLLGLATTGMAATVEEKRADVRKTSGEVLQRLYQLQPRAKGIIDKAAGHAVFSNFGMKILVAGGGQGQGMAVDHKSGKETFMKMVEVQAGLGFGVKKFQLVWVFDTKTAFDKFVNSGWEIGAQTTAAAQLNQQGAFATGAMSVSPGIWLYQIAGDGLALELTAKGTKYYKDAGLN